MPASISNHIFDRNLEISISRGARWSRGALLCALGTIVGLAAASSHAVTHNKAVRHTHRATPLTTHRSLRFIRWNPLFPGSHDLLVQQNIELDRLQLPRIVDDEELTRYEVSQELVPVSESAALKIADNLPDNRRYCRPWTRDFLDNFSQAFYNQFQIPIQVNSLVRTAEQQRQLRRHNHYAAPEVGETASTHLTGVTVDLSRRGLTKTQYAWVRSYMLPLKEAGMIDPIEERQPVLHVVVFDKYSGTTYSSPAVDILSQFMRAGGGMQNSRGSEASEPTEVGAFDTPRVSQP